MDIVDRITELISPIIEERNLALVDITYKKEGRRMVLKILLDKENGITIDECGEVNAHLGRLLDSKDILNEPYTLEVSSPGLDRPLRKRKDFEWALGRCIKVTTYAPIEEKNVFIGRLLGINEGSVVVEGSDGISTEIPNDKIAKAKLNEY